MCSARELVNRMKTAMQYSVPAKSADRSTELIPGAKCRDERGRMVTVVRCSQHQVVFYREGYSGSCSLSRREFDLKFRKVQS